MLCTHLTTPENQTKLRRYLTLLAWLENSIDLDKNMKIKKIKNVMSKKFSGRVGWTRTLTPPTRSNNQDAKTADGICAPAACLYHCLCVRKRLQVITWRDPCVMGFRTRGVQPWARISSSPTCVSRPTWLLPGNPSARPRARIR